MGTIVLTAWKKVLIQIFSGPYFPAFRLNKDDKNSKSGHFSRSVLLCCCSILSRACLLVIITSSVVFKSVLTLSWRRPLSYRNQSNAPYDNGLRHERVNIIEVSLEIVCNPCSKEVLTFSKTSDLKMMSKLSWCLLILPQIWRLELLPKGSNTILSKSRGFTVKTLKLVFRLV